MNPDVLESNGSWTRRRVLGALTLVWITPQIGRAASRTANSDQDFPSDTVSFEWELPSEYAPRVAQNLGVGRDHISPAPNSPIVRGAPIIVIIIAAVLLITLARAIISMYRDLRYGGLIVQDNGGRLSVRNDPRIPGHVIIIRDRNGVTIRELRGDVSVSDLTPLLSRARGTPAH